MWVTGVHTMKHYCRHTADSSNRAGFDLTPESIYDHMIIEAYHKCRCFLSPSNVHTSFVSNLTNIHLNDEHFFFQQQNLAVIYTYAYRDLSQVLDRSVVLVASVCTEKEFKDSLARHVGLVQSHTIVRPQARQSLKCADHNNVYCAWKVCILSCLRILGHKEHVDSFFPELQYCSSTNCLLAC